jgi:hypothetical protein
MKQIDAALKLAREQTKRDIEVKLQSGLSIATIEDGQLVLCQIVETVVSAAVKPRRRRSLSLSSIGNAREVEEDLARAAL